MDSPSITSTLMPKGMLQASKSQPKCEYRLCDGLTWLMSITSALTSATLVKLIITHYYLTILYDDVATGAYHGTKTACMPFGLPGLLYASGYAQAFPVLVLLAAWVVALQPTHFGLAICTLSSAMRVRACHTFAMLLPCAALVSLQPLAIISWAAFGGDMRRWENDGRRYDAQTHTWTVATECGASDILIWGRHQTTFAQDSCIFGFMACAWYLLLGACFAVMPSKPRLLRAVFGQLPDDDGEDVAAAAADGSEERLCGAKDTDSVAEDPDSVACVVDLRVEDGVMKTGASEAS